MQWVKSRFGEKSTWAGLVPILAAIAVMIWPDQAANINSLAASIGAMFAVTAG